MFLNSNEPHNCNFNRNSRNGSQNLSQDNYPAVLYTGVNMYENNRRKFNALNIKLSKQECLKYSVMVKNKLYSKFNDHLPGRTKVEKFLLKT